MTKIELEKPLCKYCISMEAAKFLRIIGEMQQQLQNNYLDYDKVKELDALAQEYLKKQQH